GALRHPNTNCHLIVSNNLVAASDDEATPWCSAGRLSSTHVEVRAEQRDPKDHESGCDPREHDEIRWHCFAPGLQTQCRMVSTALRRFDLNQSVPMAWHCAQCMRAKTIPRCSPAASAVPTPRHPTSDAMRMLAFMEFLRRAGGDATYACLHDRFRI